MKTYSSLETGISSIDGTEGVLKCRGTDINDILALPFHMRPISSTCFAEASTRSWKWKLWKRGSYEKAKVMEKDFILNTPMPSWTRKMTQKLTFFRFIIF